MYCSSNYYVLQFLSLHVLKPIRALFGKRQHTIALLFYLPGVLKRNSSELIAMKHKLNYTVEVGSKLTTLFIFSFSESESESWFDGF